MLLLHLAVSSQKAPFTLVCKIFLPGHLLWLPLINKMLHYISMPLQCVQSIPMPMSKSPSSTVLFPLLVTFHSYSCPDRFPCLTHPPTLTGNSTWSIPSLEPCLILPLPQLCHPHLQLLPQPSLQSPLPSFSQQHLKLQSARHMSFLSQLFLVPARPQKVSCCHLGLVGLLQWSQLTVF